MKKSSILPLERHSSYSRHERRNNLENNLALFILTHTGACIFSFAESYLKLLQKILNIFSSNRFMTRFQRKRINQMGFISFTTNLITFSKGETSNRFIICPIFSLFFMRKKLKNWKICLFRSSWEKKGKLMVVMKSLLILLASTYFCTSDEMNSKWVPEAILLLHGGTRYIESINCKILRNFNFWFLFRHLFVYLGLLGRYILGIFG